MRHAQRVTTQLVDVDAPQVELALLRGALQPRVGLLVVPDVVRRVDVGGDLDRELDLVPARALGGQVDGRVPLYAGRVVHTESEPDRPELCGHARRQLAF